MKIGFVGLGIMGKPMAKNLIKAGHELTILARKESVKEEFKKLGTKLALTPAEVAKDVEIIITMLPNSPDVKLVALGENGIIESGAKDLVFIDMSSIDPIVTKEIGTELAKKGIKMLDAPVSGGEPKAIDGTVAIMVGGEKEIFDSSKKILEIMGGSVTYVGELGAGNITKLCNQAIVAINIAAVSEALMLAKKAGASPKLVYEAIKGGLAGSTVMDAKVPMMMERNFEPGFRINLHEKDLNNVMNTSRTVGASLPLTAQLMEMMQVLKSDGHGGEDHSGIVKYYEKMGNTKVFGE